MWIQLFDFEIRHVFEKKHTAVDEFLKQSKIKKEADDTENINKFINAELNIVRILILKAEKKIDVLKSKYSYENQQITYFLSIMKKLKNVSASDYFRFCKKIMRFLIQKSHLFCH